MDRSRLFRCRVLVVDDDPLMLQTTAAIVRMLKQKALDEGDAASERMCLHRRSCPTCRATAG